MEYKRVNIYIYVRYHVEYVRVPQVWNGRMDHAFPHERRAGQAYLQVTRRRTLRNYCATLPPGAAGSADRVGAEEKDIFLVAGMVW